MSGRRSAVLNILSKTDISDFINTYDLEDSIVNAISGKQIRPRTKSNHIGIEIEFICLKSHILIYNEIVNANLQNKVVLGFDGSVEDPTGNDGYEIKIIDTEVNILKTLKKTLSILKKMNAKVNSSCGLHIHLDMRSRNKEKCLNKLLSAEKLLYKMVNWKRQHSEYCVPSYSERYHAGVGEHYKGISKNSLGTIEARMHHGTLKYNEISNWIQLLLRVINSKIGSNQLSDRGAAYKLNLRGPLRKYVQRKLVA